MSEGGIYSYCAVGDREYAGNIVEFGKCVWVLDPVMANKLADRTMSGILRRQVPSLRRVLGSRARWGASIPHGAEEARRRQVGQSALGELLCGAAEHDGGTSDDFDNDGGNRDRDWAWRFRLFGNFKDHGDSGDYSNDSSRGRFDHRGRRDQAATGPLHHEERDRAVRQVAGLRSL